MTTAWYGNKIEGILTRRRRGPKLPLLRAKKIAVIKEKKMDAYEDVRDRYVAQTVLGKSFADVGGLYEIVKEKVSLARSEGAIRLALIDIEPPSCPWWEQMRTHLLKKKISDCEMISGNVRSISVAPFDVVYSSGILYHTPSPLDYLAALKQISKEFVILASTILPKRIPGPIDISFPPGSVLYVPATPLEYRPQFNAFFATCGRPNIFAQDQEPLQNWYGNWWLPTSEALLGLCQGVGFEILNHQAIETDPTVGYAVLLRTPQ
jgi:hypothetical protein